MAGVLLRLGLFLGEAGVKGERQFLFPLSQPLRKVFLTLAQRLFKFRLLLSRIGISPGA